MQPAPARVISLHWRDSLRASARRGAGQCDAGTAVVTQRRARRTGRCRYVETGMPRRAGGGRGVSLSLSLSAARRVFIMLSQTPSQARNTNAPYESHSAVFLCACSETWCFQNGELWAIFLILRLWFVISVTDGTA